MFRAKLLVPVAISLAFAAAETHPWDGKRIADWTADDAHVVLTDSPWAKSVQPEMEKSSGQRPSRGMGRRGGVNLGGIGIGLPGIGGMGRRGGGYPGGGYPGGGDPGGDYPGGQQGGDRGGSAEKAQPPSLQLRWESALPVRAAELKAKETEAPAVPEDSYAVAVYGVPSRLASGDPERLGKELKKDAALKREGKPDIKPSGVDVLARADGPVVVYLFPRSKEIASTDKRVEFDAKIGRLKIAQAFFPREMTCGGKLEL